MFYCITGTHNISEAVAGQYGGAVVSMLPHAKKVSLPVCSTCVGLCAAHASAFSTGADTFVFCSFGKMQHLKPHLDTELILPSFTLASSSFINSHLQWPHVCRGSRHYFSSSSAVVGLKKKMHKVWKLFQHHALCSLLRVACEGHMATVRIVGGHLFPATASAV